ncbi:MAG: ABC transporter permease [Deltaproteobacteria bacterium]|nr:ABC transporter permease [Deltaproteobacteria bacterium]
MRKGLRSWWRGTIPVLLMLAVWETLARLNWIPGDMFLPPFSSVTGQFYELIQSRVLIKDFSASLLRVLIGFCAGSLAGIFTGVIMGWKETVRTTLSPVIALLFPIPALGWLPLLMIWIGINELLPITIIFICSFFPVLYNTVTGIKEVDRKTIDAARVLGASETYILFHVILPAAIPNIFTGLKLEAGMAWRVIIAAEMVAIPTGIGALMMRAESLMRIDIIIVCLMVISFMCLLFERLFMCLEAKLTSRWK